MRFPRSSSTSAPKEFVFFFFFYLIPPPRPSTTNTNSHKEDWWRPGFRSEREDIKTGSAVSEYPLFVPAEELRGRYRLRWASCRRLLGEKENVTSRTDKVGGGGRKNEGLSLKSWCWCSVNRLRIFTFFSNGQDLNATLQLAFRKSMEKALSLPSSWNNVLWLKHLNNFS